jgi:hypothetical protein
MNYPTLHKMALPVAALLTSFALSAQAGSVKLSSARQTHGNKSINPIHRLLFPADTYMIDDGSAEDSIGISPSGDIIALNEFAVIPGEETIKQVDIAWGSPTRPDPSLDGLPYTVCIWSDPNGDGNPTDAQLLTTGSAVVSAQGTDTFISTDITATIATPNFFVGFLITDGDGQFPAAFDETNPTFSNRSYLAADDVSGNINNLNDNLFTVAPAEFYGIVGNCLIRANTSGGGPDITLAVIKRRQGGNTLLSLTWNPTGGGSVDVLRNRTVIATTDDDGSAQDHIGSQTGSFVYQVCVAGSINCSNEVLVRVRPHSD